MSPQAATKLALSRERDLVDEVGEVALQVARVIVYAGHYVPEVVPERVDGPPDGVDPTRIAKDVFA